MSDTRIALLIANDQYDDPGLPRLISPLRDVEALAEVLKDPQIGFFDEVTSLIDKPHFDVSLAIAEHFHRKKRDDLLLLYFSGHGILDDEGLLYLTMKNTRMELPSATALVSTYITSEMNKSRSQRKVLILDCCHSGAFDRTKGGGIGAGVGTAGRFEGNGYGRFVLTACDAIQYALEGGTAHGQAENSAFTHYLVEGLRTGAADLDGDGLITVDELSNYAYQQMVIQGIKQTPGKWSYNEKGDIVIARNPNPVVKLAQLPDELRLAVESRLAGIRLGAVHELEPLLQSTDVGLVRAARSALERLAEDDSRLVSTTAAEALGHTPKPVPAAPAKITIPKPKPKQETTPSTPDVLTINRPISLELLHIPAGEFLMGSDPQADKDARNNEQPQHTLFLPDYYMAKTPVTNAQYAAFVQATNHQKPKHWENGVIPKGKDHHPVVYVSWADAVAFCQWLGRETGRSLRLPTEAEWEKAARGTDGRIYPWGNEWEPTRCNNSEGGPGDTTLVDTYPSGASPYGCLDMAGNVWEWCTTEWGKPYPYDTTEDEWTETYLHTLILCKIPRVVIGECKIAGSVKRECKIRRFLIPKSGQTGQKFRGLRRGL